MSVPPRCGAACPDIRRVRRVGAAGGATRTRALEVTVVVRRDECNVVPALAHIRYSAATGKIAPNHVVAAGALERERMRDSAPARRIGCALRSDGHGDVRSCPANRLPPSFATRGRSSKRSGGRSGKPMVAARDCVTTRCNPADGACTPDACVRAARTCSAAWRPVEGQPDTAASSAACTCVCCLQRGDVELRHLHHRSGNARRLDLIAIGHHRNERFRNDLP